jgi:hypothetical protein
MALVLPCWRQRKLRPKSVVSRASLRQPPVSAQVAACSAWVVAAVSTSGGGGGVHIGGGRDLGLVPAAARPGLGLTAAAALLRQFSGGGAARSTSSWWRRLWWRLTAGATSGYYGGGFMAVRWPVL